MKWIKNDGAVYDTQTGELICVLSQAPNELRDKIIEVGPELFDTFLSFVESCEKGTMKSKSTYNKLKEIFSRIPEGLLYERM
jgi:hypothetical protein